MTRLAKAGAVAFGLWGALHVVGGAGILAGLSRGVAEGYGVYQNADGPFPAVAGAVLGYLAYAFLCLGLAATIIAIRWNWRNSEAGLAVNTVMIGLTEIGLVVFLILPGYVPVSEALPGFVFYIAGIVLGGLACRGEHGNASARKPA